MALGKNVKGTKKESTNSNEAVISNDDLVALKQAVDMAWASIEFGPDGTIIDANDNFVNALKYKSSKDIIGKHHRIFCDADYVKSNEYKAFWKHTWCAVG